MVIWDEIPADYKEHKLSCGHSIWGTEKDIDSGIRKHEEYCESMKAMEDN